jgi:hypothetical protein
MNTWNILWGVGLVFAGLIGITTTSCADLPDPDSLMSLRPYLFDKDHDGYKSTPFGGKDCNDNNADVHPGAAESCDGIDNNCDGVIDEEITRSFCRDLDLDGHGDPTQTVYSCAPPAQYVESEDDCNDDDPSTYTGAVEQCDGIDNDCDGIIDEDISLERYYLDADDDGFGDFRVQEIDCAAPPGYTDAWGDCDDDDPDSNPNAQEQCNGIDDDCDGAIDDGLLLPYYPDRDGDGYGTEATSFIMSCTPVAGRVTNVWDCDDSSPDIHPGAVERCNGIDDNCNESVDETWWAYSNTPPIYIDEDGDGYGGTSSAYYGCMPEDGTLVGGDCDDARASINPGATEVCNGIDDNCDGQIDNLASPGAQCPP